MNKSKNTADGFRAGYTINIVAGRPTILLTNGVSSWLPIREKNVEALPLCIIPHLRPHDNCDTGTAGSNGYPNCAGIFMKGWKEWTGVFHSARCYHAYFSAG